MNSFEDFLFLIIIVGFFLGIPLGFYYYKRGTHGITKFIILLAAAFAFSVWRQLSIFSIIIYLIAVGITMLAADPESFDNKKEEKEIDIQEMLGEKHKQLILKVIIDSIDELSEKAIVFRYNESAKVNMETIGVKNETLYSINDVVINKDINMETKKKWLGRTAVGSVVAGPFGMLIGAMTAGEKEVLKNNNSSAVISLTNLEDNSQRRLIVKLDKKNEHELRMIPTTGTTQPIDEAVMDEKDKMEAIREYKKMFDEGILTESEFNEKKQQLLS